MVGVPEIKYSQNPKEYSRLWRLRNKELCRKQAAEWRRRNPERAKASYRNHRKKLAALWRRGIVNRGLKERIWKKGEEKALDILRREGYNELIHLPGSYLHGIFDVLAKRNGLIYAFEVTTGMDKDISRSGAELARFLGVNYYVIFISPDFSRYCIKQVPLNSGRVKLALQDIRRSIPI
jgi:hypothetical protein